MHRRVLNPFYRVRKGKLGHGHNFHKVTADTPLSPPQSLMGNNSLEILNYHSLSCWVLLPTRCCVVSLLVISCVLGSILISVLWRLQRSFGLLRPLPPPPVPTQAFPFSHLAAILPHLHLLAEFNIKTSPAGCLDTGSQRRDPSYIVFFRSSGLQGLLNRDSLINGEMQCSPLHTKGF